MKILVVDDDPDLCVMLDVALRRAGLEVVAAHDVASGLAAAGRERPDAVVLDVNLGGGSGFDLLSELRRTSGVPVIMLTALDSEDHKVRGLELGADDYMTKPFGHRELVARLGVQLRRSAADPPATGAAPLRAAGLEVDVMRHTVTRDGREIELTVTEFRLLRVLLERRGRVVPTQELLRTVWGYEDPTAGDVVRVAVHRLRKKIELDPSRPALLRTVPGVGIILDDRAARA